MPASGALQTSIHADTACARARADAGEGDTAMVDAHAAEVRVEMQRDGRVARTAGTPGVVERFRDDVRRGVRGQWRHA